MLPQKKVGFSLGALTSSLGVSLYLFIIFCILSTWPCDMLVRQLGEAVSSAVSGMLVTWPKFVVWLVLKGLSAGCVPICCANVIFYYAGWEVNKYPDQIQETRVPSAAFNLHHWVLLHNATGVCMRIWLSLWAQSKAACLETTKTTTTKSYLKHRYLNKKGRRPGCTAGCCLSVLPQQCLCSRECFLCSCCQGSAGRFPWES